MLQFQNLLYRENGIYFFLFAQPVYVSRQGNDRFTVVLHAFLFSQAWETPEWFRAFRRIMLFWPQGLSQWKEIFLQTTIYKV